MLFHNVKELEIAPGIKIDYTEVGLADDNGTLKSTSNGLTTLAWMIKNGILKANLEDADRNQLIGKLHEILSLDGGTIDHVDEWGVRDLAYEIDGNKKGYYVVVTINANSAAGINEFDRITKINPNVIRHLVIAK